MTHLQALREVLLANTAVTALVGTRVYAARAPQGEALKGAFVVLRLVSAVPYASHDALPGALLDAARVQVDCYAREYVAAHAAHQVVDDVLGALSGPALSATREGLQDDFEDQTELYLARADYLVLRAAR